MVTLRDVANETQMAYSSVAAILRNQGESYSEQTRQRVKDAALRLGYQPNYLGRALAGGKSQTIGLLCHGGTVPISHYRQMGAREAARHAGYMVHDVDLSNADEHQWHRYLSEMRSRRVDGLIVDSTQHFVDVAIEPFRKESNLPVVCMGRRVQNSIQGVWISLEHAYGQIAEHLKSLGHCRVAIQATTTDMFDPSLKLQPAIDAFAAVGIDLQHRESWVLNPELEQLDASYASIRKMLEDAPALTAILCQNDYSALTAMGVLTDMGLRVPHDVSIVGCDDVPMSKHVRPALTTIAQPRHVVGRTAFDHLQHLIDHADPPSQGWRQLFHGELVVRQSTGPARD